MMLVELLTPEAILLDLDCGSKSEVFTRLARALGLAPDEVDLLVSALEEREQQGSTGIGSGVAVPHCRLPLAQTERMAYARLAPPLDWGGPDGMPVAHVFLILAPPVAVSNRHLQILAAVARLVRTEGILAQLAAFTRGEEFLAMLEREGF